MISKQDFTYYINSIKSQIEKEVEKAKNLNKAFPNAFEANLMNVSNELIDSFIHLLEKQTDDTNGWIKYYCWDLNFGEENYRLKVRDKDKKEIPLSTPEELWELLNSKDK